VTGEAEVIQMEDLARARDAQDRPGAARCRATTRSGRACRNQAVTEDGYCRVHAPGPARERATDEPSVPTVDAGGPLDAALDFIRRRLQGDYPIDDFGYDEQLSREVLLPLVRPLYERYFRVRTIGINRIPDEGAAMVVANHSGTIALDAVMLQYAVAVEHGRRRALRNVGADLVYRLPFVGPLARKTGNVLACEEDSFELFRRGELVGVFPEGYKGVGKGWRDRYKLQRFGRGGFVEVALKAQVPIIPVAIVGAEEAFPMIGNLKPLARALGVPYFPVTPTFPLLGPLGLVPLPSRWVIEFGEPIPMDEHPPDAADDKMLVFDLADAIRDRIQQMLYKNLRFRGGTFI
jgi:1-acyl-sn-glycerol-3-phosphate acyltransferase